MNTFVEASRRVRALWRAIRVLVTALLLIMIAALIIYITKGNSTPSLPSLLMETKNLHSSLQNTYDEDELARVPSYQRAQQAIEQARILARSSQLNIAIPHAQSALALMEQTEANVLRARFNQLEAQAIALQLELPLDSSVEEKTDQVQVEMQQAQIAARQGDWETALRLLEQVVSDINTQGLTVNAEK